MNSIREFRPATEQERMYTYSQSQELLMKTGAIGYLRGDFDTSGNLFYSTWFDTVRSRKTPDFKEEFDQVINAMREDPEYHGILAGRSQMSDYCRTQPDSAMKGNYTTEYAFRINTAKYAYVMRLNPTKGDYNFYVCCYQKHWLDRHLEASARGIRFITSRYKDKFRLKDGDKIRMLQPNGEHIDRAVRFIDEYHIEVGYGPWANIYHICEFAERVEECGYKVIPLRSSLPEQCRSTLPSTGEIILIDKGESGYRSSDLPRKTPEENRQAVDDYNRREGITRAQEAAMAAGSMFGWDVPTADPQNYDEEGRLIKAGERNREDAR